MKDGRLSHVFVEFVEAPARHRHIGNLIMGFSCMTKSDTRIRWWMSRLWDLRRRPLFHLVLWQLGCARAETQTTEAERDCLARHAAGRNRIAEIGIYHGVTTRRLKSVMDPAGVIVAIDPFPKQRLGFSAHRIIARRQVLRIKSGAVRWMRTTGAQAAKELLAENSRCFDFVFVDGDHSWDGLKSDWEGWSRLIAPGGIIALHDSHVTPIRDDLKGAGSLLFTQQIIVHDPDFETVDVVDSLTVLRKRAAPVRAKKPQIAKIGDFT